MTVLTGIISFSGSSIWKGLLMSHFGKVKVLSTVRLSNEYFSTLTVHL
jgi:hypothetical protein